MVKLQWKSTLFVAFALLFCSCKMDNKVPTEEPQGTLRISTVGLDQTIEPTRITTEDIAIRIENTRGEILRKWDRIADLPEQIRVVTGSYKLVAWSGDTSLLPSFVDMYYEGAEKFSVAAGQTVAVPLVVKVGVTKIKVEFDEASFADYYADYSADIRTTTPDYPDARHLNFTSATADTANFMPGTLRIRMRLTSKSDGKEYFFYPSPITGLKAAQARTVTLKVITTSGTNSLVVKTDDGYEKIEEIKLDLPGSAMPKQAPVIRANSFAAGGTLTGLEGFIPTTKFASTIIAQGGIKSVKIRTTSPIIDQMWGGRNEIEIVDAPIEVRNLLASTGFAWDEVLNTSATANVKYGRTEISLARLFGALSAEAGSEYTDYPFEIEVVDMFNQSNKSLVTGDGRFYFNVRVNKPDFGWAVAPSEGNVWSSHAEFDIQYMSNTSKAPVLQVKEGDGVWLTPDNQIFDKVEGEPITGVMSVFALKPATAYLFRLAMGNHTSTEFSATTEALSEVENGDMETWQGENLSTSPHKIPYYQPYAKNGHQYWVTNNDRTTSHRAGALTYGYNSFPAVSYTTIARNGSYAAELRNTSASNIDALNTTSITQAHSQVAGKMYIGTFVYSNKTDYVSYGKPFASRPSKLTFYHTYLPYGSDRFDAEIILYNNGVVIGAGKIESGESVGNYTEVNVDVTYTNRRLRADAMAIAFRSTVISPAAVRKVNGSVKLDMEGNMNYNKDWSAFIGSVLRIDDVSVSY